MWPFEKRFVRTVKRSGLKDVTFHTLRHTFASHLVMSGADLVTVKELMGHSDIKMTMRYAHLSKEFAKEEIKLLDGLTSGKKKEDGHEMVTSSDSEIAPTS